MAGGKYLVPFSLVVRSIELNLHKLVHIPHHHHVAVQLNDPVILLQRERCKLAPAIIEARIVGEIFMNGGEEVFDPLLGNPTDVKSAMTFRKECVGVEGNERVFGAMLLERVVESEQAREVSCVCYKSCPYS